MLPPTTADATHEAEPRHGSRIGVLRLVEFARAGHQPADEAPPQLVVAPPAVALHVQRQHDELDVRRLPIDMKDRRDDAMGAVADLRLPDLLLGPRFQPLPALLVRTGIEAFSRCRQDRLVGDHAVAA